jgi:hypothetical protein
MLDAVVASFIDGVGEREFDAAFMALLRARSFYDIHFTHGNYEFGKDFIAKLQDQGVEWQYVFQSKAGSFNLEKWAASAPQIELLRHSEVAHPNFDPALPKQAVFVMTGRLTGGSITAAQDFCRQCTASDVPLTTWDRERLIEYMVSAVSTGLAGRVEAPLLATVAAATNRGVTDAQIERFSQRWCIDDQEPSPCVLESTVVATALHKSGRSDLASYTGLALVRAACWHTHGTDPADEDWSHAASLGRRLFATYADLLLERLGSDSGPSASTMIGAHREAASLITHAVRCVRTVEIVALLGLLGPGEGTERSSHDIAAWLSTFVRRQSSAASPISDRWAVAIIPVTLLLVKHGLLDQAVDYLREVFVWIAQRYGDGSGLAGTTATPEAEVRQVIGRAVPQVPEVQRRDESYLATVLLDLCAFLRHERLYSFARDDFRRMNVLLSVTTTADEPGQYVLDGPGIAHEINAPYADAFSENWTSAAPHLASAAAPRYLQSVHRSWDHLAVSAVLRDRHFVCAWFPSIS